MEWSACAHACSCTGQSAAAALVAGSAFAADSVDAVSVFVPAPESDVEAESGFDEVVVLLDVEPRLSVMYHPLPLKTTPAAWKIFFTGAPHSGHAVTGASENFWTMSKRWSHWVQR
jgi:hypothetical protein